MLTFSINPILHGGGTMFPPWLIIARQSLMDALNWLIFHDFVPFNIRKVLGRRFLIFFLKISKILAWTIFSDFDPKGGPFYARIKKSKKSIFFCSKSQLMSLNMNYTCSKLSFEVSDMPCNQVSSILRQLEQFCCPSEKSRKMQKITFSLNVSIFMSDNEQISFFTLSNA